MKTVSPEEFRIARDNVHITKKYRYMKALEFNNNYKIPSKYLKIKL